MAEEDSIDAFLRRVESVFPSLDPDVEAAVDRIGKLEKHLDRLLSETIERLGINHGEFKLLVQLRLSEPEGPLSPGGLGERLMLSSGAMTNRLDGLERAGLVARESDPQDRRGVLVRLTDRGRTLIDEAVQAGGREEQRVLDALTPDERRRLNSLLRKLMLTFERRTRP